MPDKICVIIQGPLVTYGQGPNNSREGFSAHDTVVANTTLLQVMGATPILCLWDTDANLDAYRSLIGLYQKNQLPFISITVPERKDPDHRYKHHYAVYKGVAFARKEFDATILMKIRTDQQINETIYRELLSLTGTGRMTVSELMLRNNFYLGDFIYAAQYQVLLNYLHSQLFSKEANHPFLIIANDLGFNYYASVMQAPKTKLVSMHLFHAKKATNAWQNFINAQVHTLSAAAWGSLLWRGKRMTDVVPVESFLFIPLHETITLPSSSGFKNYWYVLSGKYKRLLKKTYRSIFNK